MGSVDGQQLFPETDRIQPKMCHQTHVTHSSELCFHLWKENDEVLSGHFR